MISIMHSNTFSEKAKNRAHAKLKQTPPTSGRLVVQLLHHGLGAAGTPCFGAGRFRPLTKARAAEIEPVLFVYDFSPRRR